MVQAGREGLGRAELGFWPHLARLDLFGMQAGVRSPMQIRV